MKNKNYDELSSNTQEIFLRINDLLSSGNKNYAEELLLICLNDDAEFSDARNKLREIQAKKINSSVVKVFSRIQFFFKIFILPKLIKKGKVAEALIIMEEALCKDCLNKQAYMKIINVATHFKYDQLVLETLRYANEKFVKDKKISFALVDAYIKSGNSKFAVKIIRNLIKLNPNNHIYKRKLQEANAVQIIDEKNWESDILK